MTDRLADGLMRSVSLRVLGRVQGVGYRAWAIETARTLGLRGWVRNRSDGSVEMLLTGENNSIAAMIEKTPRGPPAARVDEVQVFDRAEEGSVDFVARPTT